MGTRILNEIEHLAGRLEVLGHDHANIRGDGSISSAGFMSQASNREIETSTDDAGELFSITVESPSNITSIASILAWDVFNFAPDSDAFLPENTAIQNPQKRGQESGDTSFSRLMQLSRSFIFFYSLELPILDQTELDHYISEIRENGSEWSAESCLVFLVAALGSDCQKSPESRKEALRYWNMAKKRLGWALEERSLLSAQCLILAG